MANNIRGITVEIGGDTKPLSTALKGVEKIGKDLQGELREVNRQLKFDPSNTELLAQKQQLLSKQISNAKEKLSVLKEAQQQVEQQFRNGEIGEEKYRALQREVIKTESQLKNLEQQAVKSNTALSKISNVANNVGGAANAVSAKMMPATLAIGAVGVAAVKTGNDFEAQMSRVSAISGATGSDLEALNAQALQLGQDTAYSATEAAEGMENLASAGFTTKEIMQAMPGMLNLAASSGEDLASSSDIAASTLRGFGLAASEAGHVADVLAKNAADTNAAVADTGAAMKYIAPVAQNAGWSLESVTSAIGEMADAGIKGEQAGTTLRGALTNLMNPSSTAAKAMQSIGFSAYDSQGKMKPLSQIIGELNQKTSGLTNEQRDNVVATIMGTNALSGMQVLLKDGSGNLDKLTDSLKNSDGAAQKMAQTMQGNTKGSIEQMMGALETAAIKVQQVLAPIITQIANYIANLAESFSNLSPAAQKMILVILGIIAIISPVAKVISGISFLISGVVTIITTVSAAIAVASGTAVAATPVVSALAGAFTLLTGPVGIAIAIIAAVIAVFVLLWNKCEWFRNFWINLWNNIKTIVSTAVTGIVTFFTVTIPQAWNTLVAFFTGIPVWWSNLWAQVGQFFSDCWNGIILFFTTTIPQWIQSVIQWFNELPYNIGYAIGSILAAIVNFGVDAWNWVTTQLPNIINGIIQWFAQLPTRIGEFLTNIILKFGTWALTLMTKVTVEIPLLISRIVTFFSQLPGKIWAFLVDVVNKVVKWCVNLVTTAATEIPKFVSTVVQFVSELPSKMLYIGKNVVQGIWDGINGAVDWLHDRIASFCEGVVSAFKSKLKIHSPSRLFADVVGKNIALGIGQGFTDSMKTVVSSMTAAIPTTWDTGVEVHTAVASAYGNSFTPALTPERLSAEAQAAAAVAGNITVNQSFQGKVPTPAENARLTRNGLQQMVLKLRK